jgi:hypothetical protein
MTSVPSAAQAPPAGAPILGIRAQACAAGPAARALPRSFRQRPGAGRAPAGWAARSGS